MIYRRQHHPSGLGAVSREICEKIQCGLLTHADVGLQTVYDCARAGYTGVRSALDPVCQAYAGFPGDAGATGRAIQDAARADDQPDTAEYYEEGNSYWGDQTVEAPPEAVEDAPEPQAWYTIEPAPSTSTSGGGSDAPAVEGTNVYEDPADTLTPDLGEPPDAAPGGAEAEDAGESSTTTTTETTEEDGRQIVGFPGIDPDNPFARFAGDVQTALEEHFIPLLPEQLQAWPWWIWPAIAAAATYYATQGRKRKR